MTATLANGRAALTIDEVLARKRPNARLVPVLLDPDLMIAVEDARTALDTARALGQDLEPRREALAEAQRALDAGIYWWRLEAIAASRYRKLVEACPPTPEQIKQAADDDDDARPPYDPVKFFPKLLAACCVDPKLTEDQAVALWAEDSHLSGGELTGLTTAALLVCSERSLPGR